MSILKAAFPFFKHNDWAYLDNAATTQKPQKVLTAINDFYLYKNANPQRGAYTISELATQALELARAKVQTFIGAKNLDEIIFTKSATEAINLVAQSWGTANLSASDEILVAISEHHSNFVPWQILAKQSGAKLVFLNTDKLGRISDKELAQKINKNTKLLAIAHVSNLSGAINPLTKIIEKAHHVGAFVLVDAAQSVGHIPINMADMDADFLVFSAHKMYGSMGIGVLYAKTQILSSMPPFIFGGGMVEYVEKKQTSFAPSPQKFEGGTPDVASATALAAAISYLEDIGIQKIQTIEQNLAKYLLMQLHSIPGIRIIGPQDNTHRLALVSFNLAGVHPHDLATILSADKVAIRSGHHCAQPFMKHLGLRATCRASLALYNSQADIDRLITSIYAAKRRLKL